MAAADDPSTNYVTHDEEMIARMPILTATAAGDIEELELVGPFTGSFPIGCGTVCEILLGLF